MEIANDYTHTFSIPYNAHNFGVEGSIKKFSLKIVIQCCAYLNNDKCAKWLFMQLHYRQNHVIRKVSMCFFLQDIFNVYSGTVSVSSGDLTTRIRKVLSPFTQENLISCNTIP